MNTEIFNYNGTDITFQLGNGDVMVNATEMAKPFGKRPSKYLELPSTKELIDKLQAIRKSDRLISTVNGKGTWMHEDVALDFARWLSVDFRIWCNDRIKEVFTHGFTATNQKLEELANNPELLIQLATNLKNERAEKESLQLEIATKHKPRSEFVDQVFNSDSLISMSQASKSLGLGFGRNTLFKKLRERGVLFKNSNEPRQEYINRGYFKVKEKAFTTDEGKTKIKLQTYVTQKGLGYIAKIFQVIQLPVNKENKTQFISA